MATTPGFANTPRMAGVAVSAANVNRDGTGTIVSVLTGVAAGTQVYEVDVQWTVTSTAGMLRLFTSTDAGATWKLFDEIPVTAITVGASTAGFRFAKKYDNLFLPNASAQLGASTHNAEASNVFAFGGDLT